MDTEARRQQIETILSESHMPVSATQLAARLGVSRQVIVGDIALIRAKGTAVLSTPKGYMLVSHVTGNRYRFTIACSHTAAQTPLELYTIVDHGGTILDVKVDHPLYGELSCNLNIATRSDVDDFLKQVEARGASLLSDLTGGVHLHTVSADSRNAEADIIEALQTLGLLYSP